MDEQKFQKALDGAKLFSIIILFIFLISFAKNFSTIKTDTIGMILIIVEIALLLASTIGFSQKMLYGPICGIIVSIIMILSLNTINIALGIGFIIECIYIIKTMKTINNQ